jgi:transcriptional regulator with XRE-family HTH domain
MSAKITPILDPSILAWWTRAIREASHCSQEALAESSGLDVRTIQRIEAGRRSDVTTRRALARGLGYDNLEIFFDPQFAQTITGLFQEIENIGKEALQKQFPDKIRLRVTRVRNGAELVGLADAATACNYVSDDELTENAQGVAATLFDYLNEYGDAAELYSNVDKLHVHKALDALLRDLDGYGAVVYSAVRHTSIVGERWPDQTPMPVDVLYLLVHCKEKIIKEFLVSKEFRFGIR